MNDGYEDKALKRMQDARKRISEASDQSRREALRMQHLRAVARQAGDHSKGQRTGCIPLWGIFFAVCLALAMIWR